MTEIPSEFPASASDFHQNIVPKEKVETTYEELSDSDDPISFTRRDDVEPNDYKNPNNSRCIIAPKEITLEQSIKEVSLNEEPLAQSSSDYLQVIDDSAEISPFARYVIIKASYKCDVTLPSLKYYEFESDLDTLKNCHPITIHNVKNDVWHVLHSKEQNINNGLSNITLDRGARITAYATKEGWLIA